MLTDYDKYLETEAESHKVKERLNVGDKVFILNDINLIPATVVKLSNRSAKVEITSGKDVNKIENFPYTKIAKEGDVVAVVWETWRGNAARGGYRIERTHFPTLRIPVESIPKKLVVVEESLGVTPKVYHDKYLAQLKIPPVADTNTAVGGNGVNRPRV